MQLIAHGGAVAAPAEPDARQRVLDDAVARGSAEGTPVDAVETAIACLEASPRFNAGIGSAVQSDGISRTDAGIMTDRGACGAACAMPGVANAIGVARVVMEETPHVLLAGVHAVDLAEAFDIAVGVDLWTDETRERWAAAGEKPDPTDRRAQLEWVRSRFGGTETVGAVATDGDAVAAGTSSGGRWLALAGRVGDVPQIGAGYACSPAGGASATGHGEDIARVTLSRTAVAHLEDGMAAGAAADRAIETFERRTDGVAGIVVCDRDGRMGVSFTDGRMQTSRTGTPG